MHLGKNIILKQISRQSINLPLVKRLLYRWTDYICRRRWHGEHIWVVWSSPLALGAETFHRTSGVHSGQVLRASPPTGMKTSFDVPGAGKGGRGWLRHAEDDRAAQCVTGVVVVGRGRGCRTVACGLQLYRGREPQRPPEWGETRTTGEIFLVGFWGKPYSAKYSGFRT